MEQQIISVLYVKPFRFFNVLQIRYILEKEQIVMSKECISEILEYFLTKEMLCRIRSKILNNPYLNLYGGRIIYKVREWEFMHDISEFVRTEIISDE